MPFTVVRQDITKMKVDAVVNAADTALKMGGGVCGAIFKAAGVLRLTSACKKLAPIRTGDAVLTPGFKLPAKYIIHTAGPVYRDGSHGEQELLRACYLNSLKRAVENNCASVAFPLISSGIYGYPKEEALLVATDAIRAFLEENELDVYLAVFDKASFTVGEKLLGEVASYIDEHYAESFARREKRRYDADMTAPDDDKDFFESPPHPHKIITFSKVTEQKDEGEIPIDLNEAPPARKAPKYRYNETDGLSSLIDSLDEPFSQTLLHLIDAKGRTDVEVYKRANLDRKLFSKIRGGNGYTPSKRTALALAVALELTLEETEDLLRRAGYALSHSQKSDVIIEYFIINGMYDIYEINGVLFKYDQPLLGG